MTVHGSEDESESTENEKTPQQKTRRGGPKQIHTLNEESNALGSGADSHVSTPGKNFDADYPEGSADADGHVSTPTKNFYADYHEGSGHIGAFRNDEDDSKYEDDLRRPTDVQSPPTPAPGSEFWSEDSDDTPDGKSDAKRGPVDGEPASPAEDGTKSKDGGNVTDVDDTASDIVESTLEPDLGSNAPPVSSSRPTTPEAASTLLSIASNATGEAHGPRTSGPPTHTEGDQALMAALRGSWVGQYFA